MLSYTHKLTCVRAQIKCLPVTTWLPGSYFLNNRGQQLITMIQINISSKEAEELKEENRGKKKAKLNDKGSADGPGITSNSLMYSIHTLHAPARFCTSALYVFLSYLFLPLPPIIGLVRFCCWRSAPSCY